MKFLAIIVMMACVLVVGGCRHDYNPTPPLLLPAGRRMCSGLHAGLQSVRPSGTPTRRRPRPPFLATPILVRRAAAPLQRLGAGANPVASPIPPMPAT